MEILDNMPHDRLYRDENGDLTTQAMINIQTDPKSGEEMLEEVREPIDDQLVKDFLKHLDSMP